MTLARRPVFHNESWPMVGTSHSTIVRLEHADYTGHSLTLLTGIASALGKHVQVTLVDAA